MSAVRANFIFFTGLVHLALNSDPISTPQTMQHSAFELDHGGIVRTDRARKDICLVFTGHEFADGGDTIVSVLRRHKIRASFFFTGDFYRNPAHRALIRTLKKAGQYLGAHSDKHLLYCAWENRDSTLVTKTEFLADIKGNYAAMEKHGISVKDAPFFLPAYEWYNDTVAVWAKELGLTLINFTPGTSSNADYTTPDMGKQYRASDEIYERILHYEGDHKDGLNGFILLTHIGTDPRRTDKFYLKLDALVTELVARGYRFTLPGESIPEH